MEIIEHGKTYLVYNLSALPLCVRGVRRSLGYCKSCDPVGNNCEACWNMPVEDE